jgi:fructokinase
MTARIRVVGLGEVLWDILPDGTRHLGGAPMNVAVHAQALGSIASVISAVGDDDLGREALALLRQTHGLDAQAVEVLAGRPTGAVDVRLKDGQPTYEFRADVAWDFLSATAAAMDRARTADAIVFGTLAQRNPVSRRAIHDLVAATTANCLRVFDVNLRPPFYSDEIIRGSLETASLLKLNDNELPIVLAALGIDQHGEWKKSLFDQRPQLGLIALTRGERGSTLYARERTDGHSLPARKVTVKDTVGAGDAFTAALVAGLLRRRPLEVVHEQAVAAAAFVCSQAGATPRLPREVVAVRDREHE